MASPAERYAAARRRTEESRTELAQFAGTLGFDLDGFQLQACQALESGRGVLVAAPTGAGKTVVGEFAAHLALQVKAFKPGDGALALKLFRSNRDAGLYLFAALALGAWQG